VPIGVLAPLTMTTSFVFLSSFLSLTPEGGYCGILENLEFSRTSSLPFLYYYSLYPVGLQEHLRDRWIYLFRTKIAAFNAAAKVTQLMYGIRSAPARVDILKNLITVRSIAIQRTAITITP